jgi:hypothetical protein
MKNIVPYVLLVFAFASLQAQTEKTKKDIYAILEVYEKTVTPYLDEKISREMQSPTTEKFKAESIARRMSIIATIEGINKETRIKFKNERLNITNVQAIKEFIEYRYRVNIGGLPDEFYRKVSEELDKS